MPFGRLVIVALVLLGAASREGRAHGGNFTLPPIWNPNPVGPPPGRRPGTTPGPAPAISPGAITNPALTASEDPEASWGMWWLLNRHRFLARPLPQPMDGTTTPSEGAAPSRPAYELARERARGRIAPFLHHLLASPMENEDVRASSLLALAKVSNDDKAVETIRAVLEDPAAPPMARSSAALALGLLRRTDPTLRRDGAALDAVREALLQAFDDTSAPTELRTFAALGLGLLADQPYGSLIAKDGKLIAQALWKRLGRGGLDEDLRVALFTALGLQPAEGVHPHVRHYLEQIVIGRAVYKRVWSERDRSHALTTQIRLGGTEGLHTLLRVLSHGQELPAIRRAAYLGVGQLAERLGSRHRLQTTKAVLACLRHSQDDFTRGLGLVAVGHLAGADIRAGGTGVVRQTKAGDLLLGDAKDPRATVRGFAILGLGLAARSGDASTRPVRGFLDPARRFLLKNLEDERPRYPGKGSFIAAIGLAQAEEGRATLIRWMKDADVHGFNRATAALSLGALGGTESATRRALARATGLPVDGLAPAAARSLASLGGSLPETRLLSALEAATSQRRVAGTLLALGRLQDPEAAPALIAWARDETKAASGRAHAVVALGLLGDPEPRPSLSRITRDGNYPARTKALAEAWSLY